MTVAGSTSNAGPWSYQFNSPTAITFDSNGYMYILDYNNNRIQKWYPGASYGSTVASGTMNLPVGFRFDRLGNLVVADTSNHRIISFSLVCRKLELPLWTHFKFISFSANHNNINITTR